MAEVNEATTTVSTGNPEMVIAFALILGILMMVLVIAAVCAGASSSCKSHYFDI